MVDTNKNNLVVGYSYLNQPLLMNLTNDTSILVIGKKGSGTGMLLSCLAITYAFLSTPDKFNIDIISKDPSNNFNSLKHLPHVKSFSTLDITNDNIGNMLLSYNNEIIDRKNAFEQLSASNIDEYNIAAKETGQELMPTKLLIISDMHFDQIQNVWYNPITIENTNFEEIERKYKEAGYKRPGIVFWNVNASNPSFLLFFFIIFRIFTVFFCLFFIFSKGFWNVIFIVFIWFSLFSFFQLLSLSFK